MKRLLLIGSIVLLLPCGAVLAQAAPTRQESAIDHHDHHHEESERWTDPAVWRTLKADVNGLAGVLAVTAAIWFKPRHRRSREVSR